MKSENPFKRKAPSLAEKIEPSVRIYRYRPEGFAPDEFKWVRTGGEAALPGDLESSYQSNLLAWNKKLESGEIFEGRPKPAFKRVVSEKGKKVIVEFGISGYIHQRAMCDVFKGLSQKEREELINRPFSREASVFSCTFGAMIAVVTSDSRLIFCKRSAKTAVNAGKMVCTVSEGVDPGELDPWSIAARGLMEELGIKIKRSQRKRIKLTSLVLNTDVFEWGMLGHVDMREWGAEGLTLDEILQGKKGAVDSWELAEVIPVKFTLDDVCDFMLSNRKSITNYSKTLVCHVLCKSFGETAVSRHMKKRGLI